MATRVAERMMRWMRRRKLVDERPLEERSNEAPELSPLEACMQLSLFGGTFLRLGDDGVPVAAADRDDERLGARGKGPWTAEVAGFNIHAAVTVRAGDVEGRERLCRYGARPPFSLERLSLLPRWARGVRDADAIGQLHPLRLVLHRRVFKMVRRTRKRG